MKKLLALLLALVMVLSFAACKGSSDTATTTEAGATTAATMLSSIQPTSFSLTSASQNQ